MERTSSPIAGRTLSFKRSRTGNGILARPTTTFLLSDERGAALGQLSLRGWKADYVAANNGSDSFRLRRNFWGTRWLYEGDAEEEFGRYSYGWNFKPAFIFRNGDRYTLKATHRWPFRGKKPGEPSQKASFFREEQLVMELNNDAATPFFYNEVRGPMEGTIVTHITHIRIIAGLLLLFQTHLEARNRSAH